MLYAVKIFMFELLVCGVSTMYEVCFRSFGTISLKNEC